MSNKKNNMTAPNFQQLVDEVQAYIKEKGLNRRYLGGLADQLTRRMLVRMLYDAIETKRIDVLQDIFSIAKKEIEEMEQKNNEKPTHTDVQ